LGAGCQFGGGDTLISALAKVGVNNNAIIAKNIRIKRVFNLSFLSPRIM